MFLRILLGALVTAVGVLFVMKSEWLYQNVGAMEWADKYLGTSGGSRLGYKLIGLLAIFIGILVMTNLYSALIMAIFGKIFKGAVPSR
jgi:hypothetical protein